MTDKPILFRPDMIRALLEGRKTQTRRVLKYDKCGAPIMPATEGDRLWVREHCATWGNGPGPERVSYPVVYAADDPEWQEIRAAAKRIKAEWKVRPSIHMPRWASRLTLTVTDVRVQRVQEISEDDAIAEGIELCSPAPFGLSGWRDYGNEDAPRQRYYGDPRDSFFSLWNSIHGEDAWDRDDWVSAISFTVHRCNIDQREDAG